MLIVKKICYITCRVSSFLDCDKTQIRQYLCNTICFYMAKTQNQPFLRFCKMNCSEIPKSSASYQQVKMCVSAVFGKDIMSSAKLFSNCKQLSCWQFGDNSAMIMRRYGLAVKCHNTQVKNMQFREKKLHDSLWFCADFVVNSLWFCA